MTIFIKPTHCRVGYHMTKRNLRLSRMDLPNAIVFGFRISRGLIPDRFEHDLPFTL